MKHRLLVAVKISVTCVLLYWVLRSMNLDQAGHRLAEAHPSYLLATLGLIWFGHFLCVIRWDILLRIFGIPLPLRQLVRIYGIGMFFNLVLPGLVGGDLVKGYLAGRDGRRPYSLSFASVFLDRDLGFVAMVLQAVVAAALFPVTVQGYNLLLVFLGLLGICILANLILFHPLAHRMLQMAFSAGRFPAFAKKLESLSQAFHEVMQSPARLAIALFISLVNQFLMVVSGWFIARALDINAPFFYFMVFIPATAVITMIPISINGVGLREFAFMRFFASIGVSQEQGALLGFLSSIVIVVSGLPGAIAYLIHKKEVSREKLEAFQAAVVEEAEVS